MTQDAVAITSDKTKLLRNAIWNSIAFQVIIVLLSVAALNPYTGPISLVALAGYWAGVVIRAATWDDGAKATRLDLHLLRWGYFWAYCLVAIAYYVLVQAGWK